MITNTANLANLFRGYNAAFKKGFDAATVDWEKVATLVKSTSSAVDYGWLDNWPKLREWIGDRVIKNLKAHHYAITNKDYEATIGIPVSAIEDDQWSVYSTVSESQGQTAREHPNELVFALLAAGASTLCFDGQNFLDTDHPVAGASVINYDNTSVGGLWVLMDTRGPLKPLIYQERKKAVLQMMNKPNDEGVFMDNVARLGVHARANVGFGFWQKVYGSINTLNAANFKLARAAMRAFKSDEGQPLNVAPNLLVVGPSNESAAEALLKAQFDASGATNTLYKAAELLVTPYMT